MNDAMRSKSSGAADASSGKGTAGTNFLDAAELSRQIAEVARNSEHLVADFLKRQGMSDGIGLANSASIAAAFFEMTARMMADPAHLVQAQVSLWNDYMGLWQRTVQRFLGGRAEPMIEPPAGDRRFRDAAWDENTLFDFISRAIC